MGTLVQLNTDATSSYLRKPVRSERRAVADMIMDTGWDHRTPDQRYELHQRAVELGLDFYDLRARGWKVTRLEARRRIDRERWV